MIETVLPIGGCRNTIGYAIIRPRKINSPVPPPPPPSAGYKIYYSTVDGSSLTQTDLKAAFEEGEVDIDATYTGPEPDYSVSGEISYPVAPDYLGAILDPDDFSIEYGPLFCGMPGLIDPKVNTIEFSPGITSLKTANIEGPIGVLSYCENLKTVILPEGLLEIQDGSFSYCPALGTINIPSTVTSLGEEAFYNCESDLEITCAGVTYNWATSQDTIDVTLGNGETVTLVRKYEE